ncbi:Peroxisomal 2,4-dienoyl-CoA reductase [Trichoplax sp. H2]|uniref:Peroxisomal 2,4-dienoyl-CoA reductase [(3E)-enoyl-CoA-producing] n=1 Tax=Trichoplax adhaerens TaxID=10228 RepID=B3S9I0_TRIAD|nr:hypothetical protein TRIADDRAFT_31628 [Trichoplax adhaerens]EDV20656.1 hypothetical protein TRIADDRAFT_31628 [Trichoplax adhaerens]RDD38525.1 Peroxisomal 2,4-dienoyl-CoA reductase [Trichoplax sp. H2]|eukprot:XP_002116856.1 hypothetical protein TRIADDRAFT_31628 [Trichoplax adhaerens]
MAHETDQCLKNYKYYFKSDILANKVAFISGGGSGICFRITEIYMRHGCDTVIASRNFNRVKEAAERLEKATGRRCLPVRMDVRKPQEIQDAVDQALSHYNRIDILINGAAGNFLCPASRLSYNAFRTVIEIDTLGTFNLSKAVYEKYFSKHGGNIINISATLHYNGDVLQVHVGAAKAAIDAMTKHLAREWGRDGVRVNCIAPGPIADTEGMRRLGGDKEELARHVKEDIPLGRMGSRIDIGDSAVYLGSEVSSYITGTVLIVDGGTCMVSRRNIFEAERMMRKLASKL